MPTIKRYLPDGTTRQVMDEATLYRTQSKPCFRASRVELVDGADDRFFVDFSPLYAETQKPEHHVCLVNTFSTYYQAVRAEVDWLVTNYVLGDVS